MRYLVERLPIIICPLLVNKQTQPIAISDMLDYLVAALEIQVSTHQIIEVGSSEILTHREVMLGYASTRGLKRLIIPIPMPNPLLFTHLILIDTSIPRAISRSIISSLRNENLVRTNVANQLFPNIQPISYCQAVQEALSQLEAGHVDAIWNDVLSISQGNFPPVMMGIHEGMMIENRRVIVAAPAALIFQTFATLWGEWGWPFQNWSWRIRGMIDFIQGNARLRRERRDSDQVRVGDSVDFWSVEAIAPDRMLRLRAEMKLPGRAWLQFQVHSYRDGQSLFQQTVYFAPRGLAGVLYWYLLYPLHRWASGRLIRKITERTARARREKGKESETMLDKML
jgi:hypothetical protein